MLDELNVICILKCKTHINALSEFLTFAFFTNLVGINLNVTIPRKYTKFYVICPNINIRADIPILSCDFPLLASFNLFPCYGCHIR